MVGILNILTSLGGRTLGAKIYVLKYIYTLSSRMGISYTLGENFMKYMSDQGEQDTNSVRGVLEEFTNVYVLTDISAYNDKDSGFY